MTVGNIVLGALATITLTTTADAATKNPMGIAIGNTLIGDYGSQGKVNCRLCGRWDRRPDLSRWNQRTAGVDRRRRPLLHDRQADRRR